jgi:magnesium transporter
MAYLSDIIGKPVTDVDGERMGHVEDIVVSHLGEIHHPEVIAVLIKNGHTSFLVPYTDIAVLVAPAIPLQKHRHDIQPYQPSDSDLFLVRDVLDKQIIDTNGVRVVRVNDLELTRVEGRYFVANVDIGSLGILRRLRLARPIQNAAGWLGKKVISNIISWENVELLASEHALRLKVPGDKISELHPADLAEIFSDLSRQESSKLLESLDVKTAADVLEEVEPDFQASLVEDMPDEKVADLLEEMAPDEAADLLAELPKDRSQELLRLMKDEEEEEVRKLLSYPEDLAGGIMTTEFVAVRPELTTEQVIAALRDDAQDIESVLYIYVTDNESRLVGVFSLQDLVLAQPKALVSEIMKRRVLTVNLNDNQAEVAQLVAKYNLYAIPVVDNNNHLHGIVTADDALDKIIPTTWKKRIPRWYH